MISMNNLCLQYVGVPFYYIGRSLTTVFNVVRNFMFDRWISWFFAVMWIVNMIDCFFVCLIDWLIDWLIDGLFVYWLIGWLISPDCFFFPRSRSCRTWSFGNTPPWKPSGAAPSSSSVSYLAWTRKTCPAPFQYQGLFSVCWPASSPPSTRSTRKRFCRPWIRTSGVSPCTTISTPSSYSCRWCCSMGNLSGCGIFPKCSTPCFGVWCSWVDSWDLPLDTSPAYKFR